MQLLANGQMYRSLPIEVKISTFFSIQKFPHILFHDSNNKLKNVRESSFASNNLLCGIDDQISGQITSFSGTFFLCYMYIQMYTPVRLPSSMVRKDYSIINLSSKPKYGQCFLTYTCNLPKCMCTWYKSCQMSLYVECTCTVQLYTCLVRG